MRIAFNASDGPTLGVEVELEVVDASTRELASGGDELLTELSGGSGEHPKAKHELFECTVEIITGICTTVGEARRDLEGTHTRSAWRPDRRAHADGAPIGL